MNVKIKLLEGGKMPEYATEGAAGADLHARITQPWIILPGEQVIVPTGVCMSIPYGYYGKIQDRSGWAAKYGLTTRAGVIDSDYTGEIRVVLRNEGTDKVQVNPGDRVAQIVIQPYQTARFVVVDELDDTDRGAGGFGSTGMGG